ncbi:MAG: DNA/RNA nuclease SfsA, partial [Anaerolineae bacterium]|nr:DNA/RNA nuclease SfsA [Anaerolineae bacterium]
LTLIEYNGMLVSLNSSLPNLLVARALKDGLLPSYRDYAHMQREITLGHSRIDFCMMIQTRNLAQFSGKRYNRVWKFKRQSAR